jgi:hypothetical protein
MTSHDHALREHRRRFAELVTESICQAGIVLEHEHAVLLQRFPALARTAVIAKYPAVIRDFLCSDSYKQILDLYVAGKLEVNLLSKIATMLEELAPLEFLRKSA